MNITVLTLVCYVHRYLFRSSWIIIRQFSFHEYISHH
jgi:hypothetical protein